MRRAKIQTEDGTVLRAYLQRALIHRLEAQGQRTVELTAADQETCQVESGRTGGTVAAHVDDGNSGQAEFVHRSMTGARLAEDITGTSIFDEVIGDPGIRERLRSGLAGQIRVAHRRGTRPLEIGDTHADDIGPCSAAQLEAPAYSTVHKPVVPRERSVLTGPMRRVIRRWRPVGE